jgi:hypothetical protein
VRSTHSTFIFELPIGAHKLQTMLNKPFTTTGTGISQLLYRISVDCITLSAMKNITKTEVIFVKFIPLQYTTLKLTYMLQHVYLNKVVVVVVLVLVGLVAAAAVIVIIVVVLVVEEVVVVLC